MDNVLIFASWYPSRVNFLDGDFVERHAHAIALKYQVTVIFISKDLSLKDKTYDLEIEEKGNVKAYKGFYKEYKSPFSLVRKIVSQYRYFISLHSIYKKIFREQGKPSILHVYIPMKAGIYALYLKMFKGIDYVVSEQHSYYMPASGGYDGRSFAHKYITRQIFQRAQSVHTVSHSLGKILGEKGIINKGFTVIPNVVNDKIFHPAAQKNNDEATKFVTITGNVFHKNTDGIIRALQKVFEKRTDFSIDIIGPVNDLLLQQIEQRPLGDKIIFHGAVPYERVAKIMSDADAMIFFTRYETFGCVIIEANACGLPVIASDLPVIHENITDGFNGMFVASENENELADKIIWYMDNKHQFDKDQISAVTSEKYNYETIAAAFHDFYEKAFSPTKNI